MSTDQKDVDDDGEVTGPILTCATFALPYELVGATGPIWFTHAGYDCRVDFRHEERPNRSGLSNHDDPFGRTHFSVVRICMAGPFDDLANEAQNSLLVAAANAVVDAYAAAFDAWRHAPVEIADLNLVTFQHAVESEGRLGIIPGRWFRDLQRDLDREHLRRVRDALLAADKQNSLARYLASSGHNRVFEALELTAVRSFFRRDTLTAVIVSVSAIESYAEAVLVDELASLDISVGGLKDALDVASSRAATIAEVVRAAKLDVMLKKGVRLVCGLQLSEEPFWQSWTDHYKLRCEAVHSGIAPTMADAADTLITVRRLFDRTQAALSQRRSSGVP